MMKRILTLLLSAALLMGSLSGFAEIPINIATLRPGDPVGYTAWQITKPKDVVTSREELLNAVNYHLGNYEKEFVIMTSAEVTDDMVPRRIIEVEYAYISGAFNAKVKKMGAINQINYEVGYSDAGDVMAYYKVGKPIDQYDARALELKAKVDSIIAEIIKPSMGEIEKADAIHDYIVDYCFYDSKMPDYNNAYGSLMTGAANCQGYAESLCLLLTAAGIENRFVWARSKVSATGTHGFTKALIDGMWYNIDCTVDDPTPDKKGRIKRDYLMVDDSVSEQRYDWEFARYPASTVGDFNWHYRNGMVANDTKEFKAMVLDAIDKQLPVVSIWVNDYTSSRYPIKWIKSEPTIADSVGSISPAAKGITPVKTAVYLTFTYK